jgi:plasmid maintenance system antidote protein VapI
MRTTLTAPDTAPDPRDLRARIAWAGLRLYCLAPSVGLHPVKLGRILNGKEPLRPHVAERLERVLKEHGA